MPFYKLTYFRTYCEEEIVIADSQEIAELGDGELYSSNMNCFDATLEDCEEITKEEAQTHE